MRIRRRHRLGRKDVNNMGMLLRSFSDGMGKYSVFVLVCLVREGSHPPERRSMTALSKNETKATLMRPNAEHL